MVDVLYFSDLVRMQVQDIKFCEVLQVSNPLNVVFTKHQNSESGHCVQV